MRGNVLKMNQGRVRLSANDVRDGEKLKQRSRLAAFVAAIFAAALVTFAQPAFVVVAAPRAAADEAGARRALERAFELLKAGDYGSLYDALPSASRRRVTRGKFVSGLNKARGMYALDRLEVNSVSVAADLAVADATVYGRALRPFEGEGKIVLRQYLVREGGEWRVTTGETSTVRPLLAANAAFARRHPPREPRVFVKQDGKWVDVSALAKSRQRGK